MLRFEADREINLLRAIADIRNGTYHAGRYYVFKVFEPKERLIMALPFYDRVIQHMIVNIIEPKQGVLLDIKTPRLIQFNYSSAVFAA